MEEQRRAITALNIAEAKKHFSDLLGRVAYGGQTIVISRRGKAIAKLVPFEEAPRAPSRLLDVKGWMDEGDPFFAAMEEIASRRELHLPRVLSGKKEGSQRLRR